MVLRVGLLLLALATASAAQANPEPTINFRIQRYPVTGSTTDEIIAAVFKNTPVVMDGDRFGAVTHNQFQTAFSVVPTASGGCEVKNARIVLDSTIVLPSLVVNGQSPAVLAEWERYIGALRAHELMHANNGKYIAETLIGRLYDFQAQMSCEVMKTMLDQAVDRLINNMGTWDQRLDSQTEHGKTQGAFLRPGFR
ncbi:DUF922 domain-containing Zn-dependent protease [Pseudomonas syringae pv. actinidiae]|nr:DUF922 domain-containing Zn-dependent protease [Pseudomonas syringae pv. actinidiae]